MIKSRYLLFCVLIAGAALAGFFMFGKPDPQLRPQSVPPATPVEVVEARPELLTLEAHSQGTIAPKHEITLVAQVGGVVTSVADNFSAGSFVGEGQVLAQIEVSDYEIAVDKAKAQLAQARQMLASVEGEVRQARSDWRDLGDEDANNLFLRKPQLDSARAQVKAAEADVRKARLNLERTSIKAPFPARIRSIQIDVGQYVSPAAAVARLYDTQVAEVRLPLSNRQLALIDFSNERELMLPVSLFATLGGTLWTWPAIVVRSDASVDTSSRLYYLIAEITKPYARGAQGDVRRPPLLAGQFVEAKIRGRQLDNAFDLPREALRIGNLIWWADGDRLRITAVRPLQTTRARVIFPNPFPDDSLRKVVVSNMAVAVEGMRLSFSRSRSAVLKAKSGSSL